MKWLFRVAVSLSVLFIFLSVVIAGATTVPEAPFGLHRWMPLPAVCAEARCITYRRWTALFNAVGDQADAAEILTALLTSRAASLVARRSGLSVSNAEVDAALKSLNERTHGQPELQAFVDSLYGNMEGVTFREGLRDVLVRQKLAAAGVTSPWTHAAAPTVTLLSVRYRWDDGSHRIVLRSGR